MSCDKKKCVLCHSEDGGVGELPLVVLGKRGIKTLKDAAISRGENFKSAIFVEGSHIHENCRKTYVSKKCIEQWNKRQNNVITKIAGGKRLRSQSVGPTSKLCIFCDVELDLKGNKENVSFVTTRSFEESIRKICSSRSDDWSTDVLVRLNALNVDCVVAKVARK